MEEKIIVKSKKSNILLTSVLIFLIIGVMPIVCYYSYLNITEHWGLFFFFRYFLRYPNDILGEPVFISFPIGTVLALLFFFSMNKTDLTVTDKRVYGKASWGRRVDLPLDSISAVGTSAFKGIAVASSSGKIKIKGIKNRDEIHEAISKLLMDRQNKPNGETMVIKQESPQSNADEIKQFKELLDSGIITQEEFDAKKKQLLGL